MAIETHSQAIRCRYQRLVPRRRYPLSKNSTDAIRKLQPPL